MTTNTIEETYSTKGVECPKCHRVMQPDDSFFYDQDGFEMDCYSCDVTLSVNPYCSWSWTTEVKEGA